MLRSVFLTNDSPPRWRLGWRLLFHTLLMLVLNVLLDGVVLLLALRWPGLASLGEIGVVGAVAMTLATALACRWWCRRSWVTLGLQWNKTAWRDFLAGVGIAAGAQTLIVLGLVALGMAKVSFPVGLTVGKVASTLASTTVLWAAVAWQEELWMRGYWLQNIADTYGIGWGWVLSSMVFAVLHIFNPHMSWMAVLGLVLAGLFLGYGYVRTGYLWMPLGLHFGWNMFEGTVYGFAVSGANVSQILRTTTRGPAWLTGGAFGPEAGLIVVPALLLGAWLIAVYAARGKEDTHEGAV